MTLPPPVPYAPSVETIETDEQQTIDQVNAAFDELLNTTANDYGHAVRSVHAKAHGVLAGTLTIHDDLPPELAQGMFATPGEHPVFLRLSTNAGDILPDTISLPRGLAIKVLDVEGDRLPDAEGRTQNFVLVNGTTFQAPNTKKFLGNLKPLVKTADKLEGTKEALSSVLRGANTVLSAVGIESPKLQSLGGAPNTDPLGETYYSVTPFRYGDYIAKFAVFPVSRTLTDQTGSTIDASTDPDAIRRTVRGETQSGEMIWEMRVQLCRDLDQQPVEDPTTEWSATDTPFQTVATIRAAPQDAWAEDQVRKVDEEMRFSVWVGLAAHRPLGNINRARKSPYEKSAQFRAQFNRCPIHEPG